MERNGRDWKRVGRMEEKWMMVGKKWGGGGIWGRRRTGWERCGR